MSVGVCKEIYFEKFTHMIWGAGKSKIHRQMGNQARVEVAVLSLKSAWWQAETVGKVSMLQS